MIIRIRKVKTRLAAGVSVSDGKTTVTDSLPITVEDDAPIAGDAAAVSLVKPVFPDVLTGKFSMTGYSGDRTSIDGGKFTTWLKGSLSSTSTALTDALAMARRGIGVKSSTAPTTILRTRSISNWPMAPGVSERAGDQAGCRHSGIRCQDRDSARCSVVSWESGVVEFWRDSQLIATQSFSSNAANRRLCCQFQVPAGGFGHHGDQNCPDNGKSASWVTTATLPSSLSSSLPLP